MPSSEPAVERALRSSHAEGAFSQITSSIHDHYLAPCALFLGASAAQVGWLAALPRLTQALAQLASARAVRAAGDRRRLLVAGAFLQGLALIPVALAALHPRAGALWLILAAAMSYQLVGGFMYPAWASLMSEYLPAERRAGYFGRRNRGLAVAGLGALAVWGLVLDDAGPLRSGAAFAALFACAALCRILSTRWMSHLAPRPWTAAERPPRPWRARLDGRLGRLALYAGCAGLATQLGDAMQPVRLLHGLHYGYRDFMLVRLAGGLGAALTAAWWGRVADRRGPVRPLRAAGLLMVIASAVWATTGSLWVLMCFEVLDGAAAAGFALCAVAHLYDAVEESDRLRAVGLYTLCTGAAVFVGAGLSGSLAGRGVPLRALFLTAACLRAAVELTLGTRVQEARQTPGVSGFDFDFRFWKSKSKPDTDQIAPAGRPIYT